MNFKKKGFAGFKHLELGEGLHSFSANFRFQSVEKLLRLKRGFRFPSGKIRIHTYQFDAEEIIMISLFRLAHPDSWASVGMHFPGRPRWEMARAFYWFLDFLIYNWGYLLLNNMEFWLPYLGASAEAIRCKFVFVL